MKKRFGSAEATMRAFCNGNYQAHNGSNLWSEQVGDLAIIYSYGRHYPLLIIDTKKQVGFINVRGYSVTTSKHIGLAKRYFEGMQFELDYKVIIVGIEPNIADIIELTFKHYEDNIKELKDKITRARSRKNHYTELLNDYISDLAEVERIYGLGNCIQQVLKGREVTNTI